eukprot:m.178654 g.178654  ORF g.178654 m.178654 type:complete len:994 (-) comp15472_c0_seq3:87-3068(-)
MTNNIPRYLYYHGKLEELDSYVARLETFRCTNKEVSPKLERKLFQGPYEFIVIDKGHVSTELCYKLYKSKNLQCLQELHLVENGLEGEVGELLAKFIESRPKLHTLTIAHNNLTNDSLALLGGAIASSKSITSLSIRNNDVNDLAPFFAELNKAETLTLVLLDISHLALFTIKETQNLIKPVFDKCRSLTTLNLSHSNFGDAGTLSVLRALKESKTIRTLDLSGNLLTRNICFVLSDFLGNNDSIKELNLSENYIGEHAFAIETHIKDCQYNGKVEAAKKAGHVLPPSEETSEAQKHTQKVHHRTVFSDFATGLGANRSLTILKMSDNGLSNADVITMFKSMCKHGHKHLVTIELVHKESHFKHLQSNRLHDNFEFNDPMEVEAIEALMTASASGELKIKYLNLSGVKRLQSEREAEVKRNSNSKNNATNKAMDSSTEGEADLSAKKVDTENKVVSENENEETTENSRETEETIGDIKTKEPSKVHPSMTPAAIQALFKAIGVNLKLSTLLMDFNHITLACIESIVEAVSRNDDFETISFDFCTFECDENGKSGVGNIVGELVRKRHKIKLARFRGCDIRFQDIYMELSKMESWEIVQQKAPMVLDISYNRLIGFNWNDSIGTGDGEDKREDLLALIQRLNSRGDISIIYDACDLRLRGADIEKHCFEEINFLSIVLEKSVKRRLLKQCRAFLRESKIPFHINDLESMLLFVKESAELNIHMRFKRTVPRSFGDDFTSDITLMQKLSEHPFIMNLFQAGFSGGNTDSEKRKTYERNMFGRVYDTKDEHNRPKYGAMNILSYLHGDQAAKAYGKSYISLKPEVRPRVTISSADSVFPMIEMGTLDHSALVLLDCLNRFKRVVVVDAATDSPVTVKVKREDGTEYETYEFRDEKDYEQVERKTLLMEHLMHVGVNGDSIALAKRKHLGLMPGYIEMHVHGSVELAKDVDLLCIHPSDALPEVQRYASAIARKFKGIRWIVYTGDVSYIKRGRSVF